MLLDDRQRFIGQIGKSVADEDTASGFFHFTGIFEITAAAGAPFAVRSGKLAIDDPIVFTVFQFDRVGSGNDRAFVFEIFFRFDDGKFAGWGRPLGTAQFSGDEFDSCSAQLKYAFVMNVFDYDSILTFFDHADPPDR